MKKVMAGIDLHSNNLVVGIMDQDGKRVGQQKLPCELEAVEKFLSPFKERLEQVAVESTYNWYWLVDGLQAAGYPVAAPDARPPPPRFPRTDSGCRFEPNPPVPEDLNVPAKSRHGWVGRIWRGNHVGPGRRGAWVNCNHVDTRFV